MLVLKVVFLRGSEEVAMSLLLRPSPHTIILKKSSDPPWDKSPCMNQSLSCRPNESQNEQMIQLLWKWVELGSAHVLPHTLWKPVSDSVSSKESHLRFPATLQIAKQIRAAVGRLFNYSKQHLSVVVKVIIAETFTTENIWNWTYNLAK